MVQPRAHESEIEELIFSVQEIAAALNEEGLQDVVTLSVDSGGVTIRVSTPFLFASAQARLRPAALPVLNALTASLARIARPVRVEGHTDNLPIATADFPSNWELAGARSLTILRYFEGKGIPPERLCAVSHGEYAPVAANDTPEGRARNRRVELYVELADGEGARLMESLVPAEE